MILAGNAFDESSSAAWLAFNTAYVVLGGIVVVILQGYIARHGSRSGTSGTD
jgi:hypothetical protein